MRLHLRRVLRNFKVWYNSETCSGRDTEKWLNSIRNAEVAELADALRSGRSELKLIGVQIPAPALSSDLNRT